jgi:hypothetical protein
MDEATNILPCEPGATKHFATLGEAASLYALNGWNVIPLHTPQGVGCSCGKSDCGKPGKHPRIAEWQENPCDPEQVARWWQQWPSANVALRLDGLIVLDVDGPKGFKSLAELEAQFGPVESCAIQRSGGGGRHYLFCRFRASKKVSGSCRAWIYSAKTAASL